ncbi:MAG: hypothetical protein QUV08_13370 [Parasphingorhabdus sp.]|nr:hypothetical protein [Parasphingorhabdus sp.]
MDENVIGLVFRDLTDNDYGWAIMARDRIGRFRAVKLDTDLRTIRQAEGALRLEIAEVSRNANLEELGLQGDEPNSPIKLLDVLPGTTEDQLHPYFIELRDSASRKPARAVIEEIGPWLTVADPHFVREFQRHQFDQRLWELYLWAMFREGGYDVEHLEAPDFKVSAPWGEFSVEATTVAPSQSGVMADHPNPASEAEIAEFLHGYMPIKYGSSLTGKLNRVSAAERRYWEEPEVEGLPFVLAVADFHKPAELGAPGSMTMSQSAIWPYLYGRTFHGEMVDGKLQTSSTKIESHTYKNKTIESGFFELPDSENVSAVIFSNAGTIAKFDRIGVMGGFGAPNHKYLRMGYRQDPNPNAMVPKSFVEEVGEEGYYEGWSDELQVFHNPNALVPLDVTP